MPPDQQLNMTWQARADRNYQRIKAFYLSRNRTEAQWQTVTANPQKFNRVWRAMLRLPLDDKPPPKDRR